MTVGLVGNIMVAMVSISKPRCDYCDYISVKNPNENKSVNGIAYSINQEPGYFVFHRRHWQQKTVDVPFAMVCQFRYVYFEIECINSCQNILMHSVQSLTRYQRLIMQLALYDMFFIVAHFISIIPMFWTTHWIYGEVGCKILSSAMSLGSFLSLSTTMLIAVERYLGEKYSLISLIKSGRRTPKNFAPIIFNNPLIL